MTDFQARHAIKKLREYRKRQTKLRYTDEGLQELPHKLAIEDTGPDRPLRGQR